MNLSEAIKTRINELTENDTEKLTPLCLRSNLTPSTIFDFLYGRTKCPNCITIKKLCAGAGITLQEFYDRDYFNDFDEVYNEKK